MGLFQKLFGHIVDAAVGQTLGKSMFPQPMAKKSSPEQQKPKKSEPLSIESLVKKIHDTHRKAEEDRQRAENARAREPWYRFINLGIPIVDGPDFKSSNVQWMQYDIENGSLYIEYIKNGCTYRYWPVNEDEAKNCFLTASKGGWVWDRLRIRTTNLGHRKNYMLTGQSMNGAMPKWTGTAASIQSHDQQVGVESLSGGPHQVLGLGQTGSPPLISPPYKAIAKFALSKPKLT